MNFHVFDIFGTARSIISPMSTYIWLVRSIIALMLTYIWIVRSIFSPMLMPQGDAGSGDGGDGGGGHGGGVPTTLPSGQTPGPSRPVTKYPVRGQSFTSITWPFCQGVHTAQIGHDLFPTNTPVNRSIALSNLHQ